MLQSCTLGGPRPSGMRKHLALFDLAQENQRCLHRINQRHGLQMGRHWWGLISLTVPNLPSFVRQGFIQGDKSMSVDGGIATLISVLAGALSTWALWKVYRLQAKIAGKHLALDTKTALSEEKGRVWRWYYGVIEIVDTHLTAREPSEELERMRHYLEGEGQAIWGHHNVYIKNMKGIMADIRRVKSEYNRIDDPDTIERLNGNIFRLGESLGNQRDALLNQVEKRFGGPAGL